MNLNTQHLNRCLRTLRSSFEFHQRADADSIDQEIFRNAIVKGFELTQETCFKLLKKSLRDYGHGGRKLDELFVKDVLRLAATHGLLTLDEVERWFVYRDNRNSTAHDYGEGFAKDTLRLLPDFIADVEKLEARLNERYGEPGSDGEVSDA